jgi:peptide deformylase
VGAYSRIGFHVMCAVDKIEWSSPLEIIKYPDPRLRAVNARIATFDDNLLRIAKEMLKMMYM